MYSICATLNLVYILISFYLYVNQLTHQALCNSFRFSCRQHLKCVNNFRSFLLDSPSGNTNPFASDDMYQPGRSDATTDKRTMDVNEFRQHQESVVRGNGNVVVI